jgi:hypothetical protein
VAPPNKFSIITLFETQNFTKPTLLKHYNVLRVKIVENVILPRISGGSLESDYKIDSGKILRTIKVTTNYISL